MTQLFDVHNIDISIHRPPNEVYDLAHDGKNLPSWASGIGKSVRPERGAWIAEGPLGRVSIRFAERNDLGVLDHDVTLPSGDVVHNPMRVVPNGDGSTVTFTVLRLPGVTKEAFQEDISTVKKDLARLKELLEGAQ